MSIAVTPAMGTGLARQLAALERSVGLCDGRVEADLLDMAHAVIVQAEQRLRLSGENTIVAVAGPTGCGKSSLFNAIAELSLSRVGVRRPTTAHALACVWGSDAARPLLDWLGVSRARQLSRETVLDKGSQVDLNGLVLLDLPDFDSTEAEHQQEVDRILEIVDVMVWVFDPEKYADAIVHDEYLRTLSDHASVTIGVFNQIDRLEPSAAQACVADLRRLLAEDGLNSVEIVATSATSGLGVTELRRLLAARVAARRASGDRLAADVVAIAGDVKQSCGGAGTRTVAASDRDALVSRLATAVGVPAVADAAAEAYRQRAVLATGWPMARWLHRSRPDALRRVRYNASALAGNVPQQRAGLTATSAAGPAGPTGLAGSAEVGRAATGQAEVDTAARAVGGAAAAGLPPRWADAVVDAARAGRAELAHALEWAIAETPLNVDGRRWWSGVRVLQWLAAAVVVFGLTWLLVIAGFEVLGIADLPGPEIAGVALPVVLLVIGAGGGIVAAALAGPFVALGAARARRLSAAVLAAAVEEAASRLVIDPVNAELERHAAAVEQLTVASSPSSSLSG